MTQSIVTWADLTAPELNQLAASRACVLVPVGSTEQHGPHLVTGTDSLLAGAVCEEAARLLEAQGQAAVVTPAIWTGLAAHHVDLGGTFTLSLGTFGALIGEIVTSIRAAGFQDIVLVNGHGGNMAALSATASDLSVRLGHPVWSTTYFVEAGLELAAELEVQDALQHACEAETSMIWALWPERVRQERLVDGPGFDMHAAMQPRLRSFQRFSEHTPNGVSGFPSHATPDKGRRLLAAAAQVLARRLSERPRQPADAS